MRWLIVFMSLIIFVPAVWGASEINAFAPGISTAYAVIREADGDVWYVSGQTFEAWGTGGRTAADYDISLTDESGDMFVGDFDTNITSGDYWIATHYQDGASPADDDAVVWAEFGNWDGSSWSKSGDASKIDSIYDKLPTNYIMGSDDQDDHNAELEDWADGGRLDLILDAIVADTNELQTDWTDGGRLDVILDAIKYKTDLISLLDTTVKDANDANNFTIDTGTDVNDAYWFMAIQVEDADGNSSKEIRWIDQYDENSGDPNVWVDEPFSFTPATGDVVHIMGTCYGGYLYDIMRHAKQGTVTTNVINDTGSGGSFNSNYIKEEDGAYGLIPGL